MPKNHAPRDRTFFSIKKRRVPYHILFMEMPLREYGTDEGDRMIPATKKTLDNKTGLRLPLVTSGKIQGSGLTACTQRRTAPSLFTAFFYVRIPALLHNWASRTGSLRARRSLCAGLSTCLVRPFCLTAKRAGYFQYLLRKGACL